MYFQALLLLGYLYAHASSRFLRTRQQIVLHASLFVLCAIQLPPGLPDGWTPPGSGNVIPWLIGVLTVSLGAPFLVLSATAPLLQRWLASIDPPVRNPYVLYAASNAGSFLGLLAFPLLLEPRLRLSEQSSMWSIVYAVGALLVVTCGAAAWKRLRTNESIREPEGADGSLPPDWRARLEWVALAFVPSSLLLGVTTFLSTDVAATPLLWVIPLALYLLTFVVVFSRLGQPVATPAAVIHALLVTTLALVFFWQENLGFRRAYALHLGVFALTTLVLHGRLAASRPSPRHLTEFYLWMAFGGALGGAFTALVVPLIFNSTRDYLLMAGIACLLRPALRRFGPRVFYQPFNVAIAILPALMLWAVSKFDYETYTVAGLSVKWIATGVAAAVILILMPRPARFGVAILAVGIAGHMLLRSRATIYTDRSFFGIYRVTRAAGPANVLYHGTTIHGAQFTDSRRLTPVTYYHPNGPVGDVFRELDSLLVGREIGIVGLGTGSILCYAKPGQQWTFFEIDPQVAEIASNKRFFSFLSDCAVEPRIVFGDARLTLGSEPPGTYSVLVLDAFSSDAIPVHLLTREAFELYQRALADDGVLLVHISNRRLDLEPVVAELARDAGLEALVNNHHAADSVQDKEFDYGSDWVVLARTREDLGRLAGSPGWTALESDSDLPVWTDDYSNLFSVIRW